MPATALHRMSDRVYNEISNVAFFSTTADLWSSRTTEPYISLTIHYIDGDWKLQSKCLQTSYLSDDHSGEIIAAGLRDALLCWGLKESRQVCMTTDSGSNMIKALQLNKWKNLGCFGHSLHNAIGKCQDCSLPCVMLIIKKKYSSHQSCSLKHIRFVNVCNIQTVPKLHFYLSIMNSLYMNLYMNLIFEFIISLFN